MRKRRRREPVVGPASDLIHDMWRVIAGASCPCMVWVLKMVNHEIANALAKMNPVLPKAKGHWYHRGGHRDLEFSVHRDKRVKTFERYFLARDVVDERHQREIGSEKMWRMAKGAAYFGHLDNVQALVECLSPVNPGNALRALTIHALRGRQAHVLQWLRRQNTYVTDLSPKHISQLIGIHGKDLWDELGRYPTLLMFPGPVDTLLTGIVLANRMDMALEAESRGLLRTVRFEWRPDHLGAAVIATDPIVWLGWLYARHLLSPGWIHGFLQAVVNTSNAPIQLLEAIKERQWYSILYPGRSITPVAVTKLLSRPSDDGWALVTWCVDNVGVAIGATATSLIDILERDPTSIIPIFQRLKDMGLLPMLRPRISGPMDGGFHVPSLRWLKDDGWSFSDNLLWVAVRANNADAVAFFRNEVKLNWPHDLTIRAVAALHKTTRVFLEWLLAHTDCPMAH